MIQNVLTPVRRAGLSWLKKLPLPLWMVLLSVGIGLASNTAPKDLIAVFNRGFGRALGEFALILLPSFVLAACLAKRNIAAPSHVAALVAPFTAAGMVCPDTAYAALSPLGGRRKLSIAFGSYAGFKLLFPAGPLIVATGLGLHDPQVYLWALLIFLPVWITGELWARRHSPAPQTELRQPTDATQLHRMLLPFYVFATLLLAGMMLPLEDVAVGFFFTPKGALLLAAAIALLDTAVEQRVACVESAVQRSAQLLFVIGAASAFGAMLLQMVPLARWLPRQPGIYVAALALFTLTMLFKLIKGSSMATFATVTAVVAPFLPELGLSAQASVIAICLGSFVTILPNDSYYWLVKQDSGYFHSDAAASRILAGGAVLQATVGVLLLLLLMALRLL